MRKVFLTFILLILILMPLKSKIMTIGFHLNTGFSSVSDKWILMPYKEITLIEEWDSKVNGYFIQVFIENKKFNIGIEFGETKFYEYSAGWLKPYVVNSYLWYSFSREYNSKRILGIIQSEIKSNLFVQSGIGVYTDPPRSSEYVGPFLALMASIRYHFKINNVIELPVFLRIDLNGMRGTPIAYSMGVGLIIKWKSGL